MQPRLRCRLDSIARRVGEGQNGHGELRTLLELLPAFSVAASAAAALVRALRRRLTLRAVPRVATSGRAWPAGWLVFARIIAYAPKCKPRKLLEVGFRTHTPRTAGDGAVEVCVCLRAAQGGYAGRKVVG